MGHRPVPGGLPVGGFVSERAASGRAVRARAADGWAAVGGL